MNKTIKIYIGFLFLLFVGAIAIEFSKPKPINWSQTYNEKHKISISTLKKAVTKPRAGSNIPVPIMICSVLMPSSPVRSAMTSII